MEVIHHIVEQWFSLKSESQLTLSIIVTNIRRSVLSMNRQSLHIQPLENLTYAPPQNPANATV